MRQKERSNHEGRGNREQGGNQSLAADRNEGISANAGREELEEQQRRTQLCNTRLAAGCDGGFLHCLPWSRRSLSRGEDHALTAPGKASGDEMGC